MEFHQRFIESKKKRQIKMTGKDEGEVKDLREELEKGEMTREEVLAEMKKRGLFHHAGEPIPGIFILIDIIMWGCLCFLPVILNLTELPAIDIPIEITYVVIFFTVIVSPLLFYMLYHSAHLREKKSVTGDETIVLIKTGAYGIVRHAAFSGMVWLFVLPIILNHFANLPFTMLSILGEIALFAGLYLQAVHEEKINVRKWGDEYREYMKEVPRFNFIKGLWNLRKRS